MMATAGRAAIVIEPFDPSRRERAAFPRRRTGRNPFPEEGNDPAGADDVRLPVMVAQDGAVIGFHAPNAHADLPARFARTRPAHGGIPAACISMIGRDRKFRGGGHGGALLVDALRRIAAADVIGVAVVVADVPDRGDRDQGARRKALHETCGFRSLLSNPLRMFLPLRDVRTLIAEAEGDTTDRP